MDCTTSEVEANRAKLLEKEQGLEGVHGELQPKIISFAWNPRAPKVEREIAQLLSTTPWLRRPEVGRK